MSSLADKLKWVFQDWDTAGHETITCEHLKSVLKDVTTLTDAEINALVIKADANKNGVIEYEEWFNFMAFDGILSSLSFRSVRVVVTNVNGEAFELDARLPFQVSDLKEQVSEHWNVPVPFQRLLVGECVLEDRAYLAAYCMSEVNVLDVTFVVTLSDFAVAVGNTKYAKIRELGQLLVGSSLHARIVDAMREIGCLNHRLGWVRCEAAQVLGKCAMMGDSHAIAALAGCCEDAEFDVRIAAVEALAQVAEKGDQPTIAAMVGRLQDKDWTLRVEAVNALAGLAKKGDQPTIAAVAGRFGDAVCGVRRAAVEALAQIAEKGDRPTIVAVAGCLEDSESIVRTAALQVLGQIGGIDISAALQYLQHDDCALRVGALKALPHLAEKDAQPSIAAAAGRLEDDKDDVRQAAIEALAQISKKGDQHTIAAVIGRLKDLNHSVQEAALRALAQLVEKGDQPTVIAVSGLLGDMTWGVRVAAFELLSQVVVKGDPHAIAALSSSSATEEITCIKALRLATLSYLKGESRDANTVDSLIQEIDKKWLPEIRVALLRILVCIAGKDDQYVKDALTKWTGEETLRHEATEALQHMNSTNS